MGVHASRHELAKLTMFTCHLPCPVDRNFLLLGVIQVILFEPETSKFLFHFYNNLCHCSLPLELISPTDFSPTLPFTAKMHFCCIYPGLTGHTAGC